MNENNHLDPDDIRVRGTKNLHPIFYWRAVYDEKKDLYRLMPFMRINNSDTGRPDWMEVSVTPRHMMQYDAEWGAFRATQDVNRMEYSRAEMAHTHSWREKYEYNKTRILLLPDDPQYEKLVSNFSVRLTGEDIFTLNRLGAADAEGSAQSPEPSIQSPDNRTQSQKILDLLGMVADKLDAFDARITSLENR